MSFRCVRCASELSDGATKCPKCCSTELPANSINQPRVQDPSPLVPTETSADTSPLQLDAAISFGLGSGACSMLLLLVHFGSWQGTPSQLSALNPIKIAFAVAGVIGWRAVIKLRPESRRIAIVSALVTAALTFFYGEHIVSALVPVKLVKFDGTANSKLADALPISIVVVDDGSYKGRNELGVKFRIENKGSADFPVLSASAIGYIEGKKLDFPILDCTKEEPDGLNSMWIAPGANATCGIQFPITPGRADRTVVLFVRNDKNEIAIEKSIRITVK